MSGEPRLAARVSISFSVIPERLGLEIAQTTFTRAPFGKGRSSLRPDGAGTWTFTAIELSADEAGRALSRFRAWKRGGP